MLCMMSNSFGVWFIGAVGVFFTSSRDHRSITTVLCKIDLRDLLRTILISSIIQRSPSEMFRISK